METDLRSASAVVDAQSATSWGSIAAGAVAAAALTLVLTAFGAGLGLSSVSPWSNSGVAASTFKTGTGIYLVIVAVMSSAIGGYLAARLRSKWIGVHTHEVFFRDTAHGFIAWAFATLLTATALSSSVRPCRQARHPRLHPLPTIRTRRRSPRRPVQIRRRSRRRPRRPVQIPTRHGRKFSDCGPRISATIAASMARTKPIWSRWSPRAPA